MAGLRNSARAIASRWRCPPLKLVRPTDEGDVSKDESRARESGGLTLSIETVGHAPDKLAVCFTGGGLNLFPGSFGMSISDVLRDGAGE